VPLGIPATFVDATDPAAIRAAIRPSTRVLYLETPATPTLEITGLADAAAIARDAGVLSVVDNTFASPFNQRPLALGADFVVHSGTKYLGGHSDVMAGLIAGRAEELGAARWRTLKVLGAVLAPDSAWLVLRGIKTLPVRMERHNASALELAERLSAHPKVRAVHYPGLPDHPGHRTARDQMRGFGGVVGFEVAGAAAGKRLVDSLELIALAVSLGDTASLIQHSASMTHASLPPAARREAGITDGFLRLSVGLESVDDLWDDLTASLRRI
jgi:cystathionine beta-lyase/cystathionine gamma-synthase